jgi:hypothetical protein
MSSITARLDELGTPAWVTLMVVSFIIFWPLGLLVLVYMAWSGRMKCCSTGGAGRWKDTVERVQQQASRWYGASHSPSGNSAFDEYREETLRRLEEEQREFRSFLEQLRHAKDKAEFDQFMSDRGRRPTSNAGPMPQPEA